MIDLFSGIGGFSLAARWTGAIETVCFVEIDPFCQKVLKKHWPDVEIISDIREVTGERIRQIVTADTESEQAQPAESGRLHAESSGEDRRIREIIADTTGVRRKGNGRMDTGERMGQEQDRSYSPESHFTGIDILTGGFPCQPFSCAGKRRGTEDNRFLWPEMLRVIRQVKPTWVIAENVRGLLSIDNGLVFEQCCSEMEALGYEVQPFVIPACAVGAPHRRDRVWIVAHNSQLSGYGEHRTSQTVEDSDRTHNGLSQQTDRHAPDTRNEGLQGGERAGAYDEGQAAHGSVTERHNAWHEDWYSAALRTCVRGMDDGIPRGMDRVNRLKALGNAIVPQVAYQILMAIVEIEGGQQ